MGTLTLTWLANLFFLPLGPTTRAFAASPNLGPHDADRFVEKLLAMDSTKPHVADIMEREHLTRWVAADDSGWADLTAAVEQAGLVGEIFLIPPQAGYR